MGPTQHLHNACVQCLQWASLTILTQVGHHWGATLIFDMCHSGCLDFFCIMHKFHYCPEHTFFQNKVLKVWRSFIIIHCVSDVYSMLTCIKNQYYHQTLHFSVEVVVLILIHLDCTVVVHLLCYFLETEVMCCLRFLWWCCLRWCDTMQSPKKYQSFEGGPFLHLRLKGQRHHVPPKCCYFSATLNSIIRGAADK